MPTPRARPGQGSRRCGGADRGPGGVRTTGGAGTGPADRRAGGRPPDGRGSRPGFPRAYGNGSQTCMTSDSRHAQGEKEPLSETVLNSRVAVVPPPHITFPQGAFPPSSRACPPCQEPTEKVAPARSVAAPRGTQAILRQDERFPQVRPVRRSQPAPYALEAPVESARKVCVVRSASPREGAVAADDPAGSGAGVLGGRVTRATVPSVTVRVPVWPSRPVAVQPGSTATPRTEPRTAGPRTGARAPAEPVTPHGAPHTAHRHQPVPTSP